MATDVYRPCPCGSGKKLKFCCIDIAEEMDKISDLQEREKNRQALQLLEKMEQRSKLKPEGRAWVLLTKSSILISTGESEAAQASLDLLLQEQPDHPLGIALQATAAFTADGFEIAKPKVYRAYQKCAHTYPEIVSSLAMGIAGTMYGRASYLAAREHLALAMRTAPEQDRQEIFMHLLQFDSNSQIPFPLRSVHPLKAYTGEKEKEATKAMVLASIGCWAIAADRYQKLTDDEPENGILWHNAGMCRAWDGDEVRAAKALHKAAEFLEDDCAAVECETVAQLLELNTTDDLKEVNSSAYKIGSTHQLLSDLKAAGGRIQERELPPKMLDEDPSERPAGSFDILTKEPPAEFPEEFTREHVGEVLAQVTVFDQSGPEGDEPRVFLTGFGPDLEIAGKLFEELVGENATELPEEYEETVELIPTALDSLYWRWWFPMGTPLRVRRKLEQEQWEDAVFQSWATKPFAPLDNHAPEEAGKLAQESPHWKRRVLASVSVLDAFCDRNQHHLDRERICEKLGVEPLPAYEIDDNTHMQSLTSLQLIRLPVATLNDEQLLFTFNRTLLLHHRSFLYKVILELLGRPECLAQTDMNRVYSGMVELTRERYDHEGVLEWMEKGKKWAEEQPNAFEQLFRWELRELGYRVENPQDPELQPLVDRFWNYYGTKLPQLRETLREALESMNLPIPQSEGGIWTPESAAETGEKKKLWIPGQD